MRWKMILLVISLLMVVFPVVGCSSLIGSTAGSSKEILRKSVIGTDWQMYQLRVILPSGSSLPILLKLDEGDKVEGYFYVEKGPNIDFGLVADSEVYRSTPNATGTVASDRFSFTATKEQGISYSLLFSRTDNYSDQTVVFLEVLFPIRGGIFAPLESK